MADEFGFSFDIDLNLDVAPFLSALDKAVSAIEKLEKVGKVGVDVIASGFSGVKAVMEKLAPVGKKVFDVMKAGASGVRDALGELKDVITGVYGKLAALGGAAAAALGGISAKDMVAKSVEFEDTLRKMQAVFGDFSGDAEKFVTNFGGSIGRSRLQLTGMLGDAQQLFRGMGFAIDKGSEMSQTLVRLAVDVAAFHNANDKEVLQDFQAGLAGSERAVRQYGIFMTDAALNAELFKLGVQGGTEAASEQEIALARLNLIINATSFAHGAAARNADDLGGIMKRLQGLAEDLSVEFGDRLKNYIADTINKMGGFEKAEKVLRTVFDTVVEVSEVVIKMGADAVEAFSNWVDSAGGAVAVHFRLLSTMERVKVGLYSLSYLGKSMILGITVIFDALVGVFGTLYEAIKGVVELLVGNLAKALAFVMGGVSKLLQGLAMVFPDAIGGEAVQRLADGMTKWTGEVDQFGDDARNSSMSTVDDISSLWGTVGRAIQKTYDDLDLQSTTKAIEESSDKVNKYWDQAEAAAKKYTRAAREAKQATEEFAPYSPFQSSPGMGTGTSASTRSGVSAGGGSGAGGGGGSYGAEEPSYDYGRGSTFDGVNWSGYGYNWSGYGYNYRNAEPTLYAEGGEVDGPPGTDRVPAMLSDGEYVMNRQASRNNREFLQALNAGWSPMRAAAGSGGAAPGGSSSSQSSASSHSEHYSISMPVQIVSRDKVDANEVMNDLNRLSRQGVNMVRPRR